MALKNPISTSIAAIRQLVKLRVAPGAAPGTLRAKPGEQQTVVRVMSYGPEGLVERVVEDPAELPSILSSASTTWIDIDGLGNLSTLRRVSERIGLHPLALEDAVHSRQRAKIEAYPEHDFIVIRMPSFDGRVITEQLSIFVAKRFVVTMQGARPGDCLDPVRERIRAGTREIRSRGSSYLAYALVDTVTDQYFPVLDLVGEHLETLERQVTLGQLSDAPARINEAKHDLLALGRLVLPIRDTLRLLTRDAGDFVAEDVRIYFRDTLDHAAQLTDVVDSYREVAAGLMDIHFSIQGQRMNEIIKVLTLISTIFIPLSFIAGVYGMNFDVTASKWNMPELESPYGYPGVLGLMGAVAALLLVFFWRRGWFR